MCYFREEGLKMRSSLRLYLCLVLTINGLITVSNGQRRQKIHQPPIVEQCRLRLLEADKNFQYILFTGRDPSEVIIPRNQQDLDLHYCK